MDIVIVVLGLLASFGFIASNYALTRKWILILQGIGMFGVGSMFAVRAVVQEVPALWGVVLINSVFIVRNVILYYRDKATVDTGGVSDRERVSLGWIFFVLIVGLYFVVTPFPSLHSELMPKLLFLLPLAAAVTNVFALAQSKLVYLKWFILASVSCWVAFDILVQAWPTLIGDAFGVVATALAIVRLRKEINT